jgi:2-keto-4-pentenoate hydratase/2-oxohepta-3-ene-1,7-dioic acid hydratase in catechol pathway
MSQGTTLPAGSIIITGTPSGIGNGRSPRVWLKAGDVVCCSISHGIGSLVNSIVYEKKGDGA